MLTPIFIEQRAVARQLPGFLAIVFNLQFTVDLRRLHIDSFGSALFIVCVERALSIVSIAYNTIVFTSARIPIGVLACSRGQSGSCVSAYLAIFGFSVHTRIGRPSSASNDGFEIANAALH